MQETLSNRKTQRNMLRQLWVLGAPTILEQILQTAVGYVDTAMVGALGAGASAAVGLTTTVNWLFNGIFFAVSLGLLSYIARFVGAGAESRARQYAAQGIWILLALGSAETLAALLISPRLPFWLGAEAEICPDASAYFFIVSIPMLLRGSIILYGNILRAFQDTRTPMRINIAVNLLNILLNQLLIGSGTTLQLGSIGISLPGAGLGVPGAAIATAVSQGVGGIVTFLCAMRNPYATLAGQALRPDASLLRDVFQVSLPLVGERLVVGGGYVAFTSIIASLGTISTAAHTIALQVEEAFYIPGYGIQTPVSTLSGNAAGRQDPSELRQVVKAGLTFAVTIMTIMAVFLLLFANGIMGIFTADPQVIRLGAAVLRIVAVSEPLFAIFIILEGVFHGIGETRFPFLTGLFCMWGIRIGFSCAAVSLLRLGLRAVWVCMVLDNIARCLLLTLWYRKGSWKSRTMNVPKS